jgi:hypothetical protein
MGRNPFGILMRAERTKFYDEKLKTARLAALRGGLAGSAGKPSESARNPFGG